MLQSRIQPMLSSALPHEPHEPHERDSSHNSTEMTSWQPHKNVDIQRVTQTAIVSLLVYIVGVRI